MRVLEKMRSNAFWVNDFFKGGTIRRHYNQIKFIIENYNSPKAQSLMEENLGKLLKHAANTTPFYRQNVDYRDLKDFPIINKNVVRANYDNFRSAKFIDKENTPVVTSGSTGTPFKIWHDKNKRARNTADVIYFSERAGYHLGARLFYMKVWNDINRKSEIQKFKENILPLDIHNYTDADIKQLIDKLKSDTRPKSLVAFGSTLEVMCNYLDRTKSEPIESNILSIIANSDSLSNYAKDKLGSYFKTTVVSRYSNMENGMLSQQFTNTGYNYNVNWASFVIEILDLDKDIPVEIGKPGRVVITDLFNYCMPLIRYETGDIAIMEIDPGKSHGAPFLKSIEGRKVDVLFDTTGSMITSHIVTVNMWKYDELQQYQFVQLGPKEYEFILNPVKVFTKEKELIEEFKSYLGSDATIKIRFVKEIPRLKSGKRRLLVNKMLSS